MKSNWRRWVLVASAALVVVALGRSWYVQQRDERLRQQQIRQVGAEWEQQGLLAQADYVRLRAIKDDALRRHTVSEQELGWLLGTLQQTRDPGVRARVLGVMSLLDNAPPPQKERIQAAIAPLLQSPHRLDRNYAVKVAKNLGLTH